jgi:hypothetical protein
MELPDDRNPPRVKEPANLHQRFDDLLKRHVRRGSVDYDAFARDSAELGRYFDVLWSARPEDFPEADRTAFWLNAYNAAAIRGVMLHHPYQSVREVRGFCQLKNYRVAGGLWSIDGLAKAARDGGDYRVHFGLVCASAGAPPLRSEAFSASRVRQQLDDQARLYLADTARGLHVDEVRGEIALSKIFDWSSPDIVASRLPHFLVTPFRRRDILRTLTPYLDDRLRSLVAGRAAWRWRWIPYDWTLNSATPPAAGVTETVAANRAETPGGWRR